MLSKFIQKNTFGIFASLAALVLLVSGSYAFLNSTNANQTATAQSVVPRESSCSTSTASPTWNPHPIVTNLPNPNVTDGNCQDMPLMSFFPIDTAANNPRTKNVTAGQTITWHLYYNNGGNSSAGAITNPTAGVQVTRVNDTQYRVGATLSGGNAALVNSASKGGDLIVNVPAGTVLEIVGNNTRHFPDATERKYVVETAQGSRVAPYNSAPWDTITDTRVNIPDNSVGATTSNPVYTSFTGKTLASTTGFNVKPAGLEAGFLGYGYILGQLQAVAAPVNNTPPILPGQEITIIRGQSGSFAALNGTDPEQDYPLTYNLANLPSFCTYATGTQIINCTTNATTPVRTTFPITPTDSRGLVGTPGTFIVNVIDQNNPPIVPGQEITIVRGNSGSFNVIIGTDPDGDYPLTYVVNNLPSFCTYDAATRIVNCVTNATTPVRTTFTVTPTDSRGLVGTPGTFIVNVIDPNGPILSTSTKTCAELGTSTACDQADLVAGDNVTYTITVRNTGPSAATNVRVVDTYDRVRLDNIRNTNPAGTVDTNAGTITWNVGTLNAGASATLTFDATITNAIRNGDIIVNTALITADNLPGQTVQAQFPVRAPNLSTSTKTCVKQGTTTPCNATALVPNDTVTYSINVINTGNVNATNVRVVDTYDRVRLTNITNLNPTGTVDTNAGTITWNVGTVNAGQTVRLTFDATITSAARNGDIITNIAIISADNTPDQRVQVDFPINLILVTETPRSGGFEVFGTLLALLAIGGGYYYWKKNHQPKLGKVPSRSSENDSSMTLK
jgi:Domain of unknown function DUF11